MRIVPEYVYHFKFKASISALDGTYKVVSILSYSELNNLNIDLFATTYEPNNIDQVAFDADFDLIRSGQIVKLVSVDDSNNIQYIPEHLFDKVPDGSVQKYFELGLAVNLGIFDDAEQLTAVKNEIEQILASMVGLVASAVIYTVSDQWLTAAEYKTIDDARLASISRISNHFTDKLALIKENDSLKTKIAYYENTLKTLQAT